MQLVHANQKSEGNLLVSIKPLALGNATPLHGRVMIKLPKRAEQTKSGIYFDNTLAAGSIEGNAMDFQHEAAQIARDIIQSKDGKHMIKWGQQEKLRRIIKAEVARVKKMKADDVYGADRFNPIHGEVVAVAPEQAHLVQPGDLLYFGYLKIAALRDEAAIIDEQVIGEQPNEYGFVHLSHCYFIYRNGEFIMLNGYVLAHPIEIAQQLGAYSNIVVSKGGILNVKKDSKFDSRNAIVASAPEGSELRKGDKIMMENGCDVPLEYDVVQTLPQVYFCMRESEILAKYI